LGKTVRSGRVAALDYLRGFVVVLVVLHHSLLAYCRFGHFDRQHYLWSTAPIVDDAKWVGFDVVVAFNDGYFMALLFLLSGLFVWPGLSREGSLGFCWGRVRRLGLPFAIAVVTVIPLAYYPSFRMTGATIGFGTFWMQTVFAGPWPAGPAWFLAVLLALDLAAAAVYGLYQRGTDARTLPPPLACFGWLSAVSAIAFLPLLVWFGPIRWFTFGPFAVQASRVGFYGVYFLMGVVIGRRGLDRFVAGVSRWNWTRWSWLTVLLFACYLAEFVARLTSWAWNWPTAWIVLHGFTLVLFCAAANLAWFAIFFRFVKRSIVAWDSLAVNAYGIYILHFPFVTWMQYALLDVRLGAIVKAALVFPSALALSWGAAIMLRRLPGVARVV
jgi:glucans biosynthesis protein C